MIQLSYHPAFDAFHCIFRILRIRARRQLEEVEVDKLRILDYYLLFPWRARNIRLAPRDLGVRRIATQLEEQQDYATLPNGEMLLERMRPAQTAALQTMAQDGIIELTKLRDNIVRFTKSAVAPEIATLVAQRNSTDEDRMKIIDALSEYPLLGNDGLKGRTSLLEHRYDKI
ncbi:ABC-three component system middle component 5 [Brucella intermedia]|uniref:ABC-three component system middle component 5 n=1 Tax=Brucella intermedia TaxID=94625 RepID=UPI00224B7AA1|nr:ABC-three component system middle component 5 [Brucella intermedia]